MNVTIYVQASRLSIFLREAASIRKALVKASENAD